MPLLALQSIYSPVKCSLFQFKAFSQKQPQSILTDDSVSVRVVLDQGQSVSKNIAPWERKYINEKIFCTKFLKMATTFLFLLTFWKNFSFAFRRRNQHALSWYIYLDSGHISKDKSSQKIFCIESIFSTS
jgi:hypothetical protein